MDGLLWVLVALIGSGTVIVIGLVIMALAGDDPVPTPRANDVRWPAPRPTPLADLQAAQERIRALGGTAPGTVVVVKGTTRDIAEAVRLVGHDPVWHGPAGETVMRCTHRPCIARCWREGEDLWWGSMLWQPCPAILPGGPEAAEKLWDAVWETAPAGRAV